MTEPKNKLPEKVLHGREKNDEGNRSQPPGVPQEVTPVHHPYLPAHLFLDGTAMPATLGRHNSRGEGRWHFRPLYWLNSLYRKGTLPSFKPNAPAGNRRSTTFNNYLAHTRGSRTSPKPIPRWDVHFGIWKTTEETQRLVISPLVATRVGTDSVVLRYVHFTLALV